MVCRCRGSQACGSARCNGPTCSGSSRWRAAAWSARTGVIRQLAGFAPSPFALTDTCKPPDCSREALTDSSRRVCPPPVLPGAPAHPSVLRTTRRAEQRRSAARTCTAAAADRHRRRCRPLPPPLPPPPPAAFCEQGRHGPFFPARLGGRGRFIASRRRSKRAAGSSRRWCR